MTTPPVDVLVVGAGPTGLTLALQLASFDVQPRLVDRGSDRIHESRALAIQPRTLEVLAGSGVSGDLSATGSPAVELRMHVRSRKVTVPMFALGLEVTSYPYLLFCLRPKPNASSKSTSRPSGSAWNELWNWSA